MLTGLILGKECKILRVENQLDTDLCNLLSGNRMDGNKMKER